MNDQAADDKLSQRVARANETGGAIGAALRRTAMLANVTIGVWSAEKSDREIMEKAKKDAGAVGNIGRAIKNILSGADGKLKDAQSAYAAVRTTHYSLTLPWISNPQADRQRGPRLLSTSLFDKYAEEMGKRKRIAEEALEEFIADYPDAIDRAKTNLAALADANYPSVDEVRAAFHVTYDFVPMPAGDDFQGLPQTTLDALGNFLEGKQKVMVDIARQSMIDEIRKRVGKLVERLANEGGRLYASTLESVRDLITLLPAWNMKGEQEIADIARDIEWMMKDTTIDGIRDSKTEREYVHKKAQDIATRLEGLQ